MITLDAARCAVAARTSWRISARWRIVSASVVRIAGRSPTACWMVMTMTSGAGRRCPSASPAGERALD